MAEFTEVTRKVRCDLCGGDGGAFLPCEDCNGDGFVPVTQWELVEPIAPNMAYDKRKNSDDLKRLCEQEKTMKEQTDGVESKP